MEPINALRIPVVQPAVPECDLWVRAIYDDAYPGWYVEWFRSEKEAREYLIGRLAGKVWKLFRLRDSTHPKVEERGWNEAIETAAKIVDDHAAQDCGCLNCPETVAKLLRSLKRPAIPETKMPTEGEVRKRLAQLIYERCGDDMCRSDFDSVSDACLAYLTKIGWKGATR